MPWKNKTTLFFDLDHTLWDFDRNAAETLEELYDQYDLKRLGIDTAQTFIDCYTELNHALWAQYHLGQIDKETLRSSRFKNTFSSLGLDPNALPTNFEEDYIRLCPYKPHLFPGTLEVLDYLSSTYNLHLISNGFHASSHIKIATCGLAPFFKKIVISETVGFHKPDPAIFKFAMDQAQANQSACVMIGDSIEADVRGALNTGMDAILFNPKGCPPPEDIPLSIRTLYELKELF